MGNKSAAAAVAAIAETPLQAFERELQARYPERTIVRFEMPSSVKQCRAVYLLEVNSKDELNATIQAEALMTSVEKASRQLTAEACRRETMRNSIMGLVSRATNAKGEPTYRHVNRDGVPFVEIDNWPAKATSSLLLYFSDLNGVSNDELLEGLKGARTIGASPSPTNETPASPPTENSAASSGESSPA